MSEITVIENDTTVTVIDNIGIVTSTSETPLVRTIFVGKHGQDVNTGTTSSNAVLTFNRAMTLAAALNPQSTNPVSVVCLDAGRYTENITIPSYVQMYAPQAHVIGGITLGDQSILTLDTVYSSENNQTLLAKTTGTNTSFCHVNEIDGRNHSSIRNVRNTAGSGILFVTAAKIWVGASGQGIGDQSVGVGHIHVEVEDLYLAGTNALGVAGNLTNSTIIVRGGHILEYGNVTGTTGISVGSSGDIFITMNQIIADTAYNVNGAGNLRLLCPDVQGTRVGLAVAEFSDDVVNTGGVYRVAGTQVVGARQDAIVNATSGTEIATINLILAALRAHGLIAP